MRKLVIVETDRRPAELRAEHAHARDTRINLDRVTRQLRLALDQKQRAWDQGFAAAIDMVARGATIERLQSMVRRPGEVPVLARGTAVLTEDETAPLAFLDS